MWTGTGTVEERVRAAFAAGAVVDLREAADEDVRLGGQWGSGRTVPATLLRELLLGAEPGALRLSGARISGSLDLGDATVGHAVQLTGCHFDEPVVLRGASMRSTGLVGCRIPGLNGWLLKVDGNLFFENSVIDGRLTLTRAHITGELRLSGVHLTAQEYLDGAEPPTSQDVWALWAGGMVLDGGCFARHGFVARGGLRLVGARFNGGLFMERAVLDNPGREAFSGDDLAATTMVLADGFVARGAVRLPGASIRSLLSFDRAVLDGGLHAGRLQAGELRLTTAATPAGPVDLEEAQVTVVHDNEHSWPADTRLDGFGYTSIHQPSPDAASVERRLAWLAALPGYSPQPYEQLAAWYRKIGHDDDARRVLLAKQRRRRRTLGPLGRVWGRLLDTTVGYGYRPWQAGVWLMVLTAVGTLVFRHGQPTAVQAGQGAPFNAFVYTLDLLIPIGGFGQRTAWYWTDYHQWVGYGLIATGWVLTTAVLAGVSRSLNRT